MYDFKVFIKVEPKKLIIAKVYSWEHYQGVKGMADHNAEVAGLDGFTVTEKTPWDAVKEAIQRQHLGNG